MTTEQEAEAAVLALAQQLTWSVFTNKFHEKYHHVGKCRTEDAYYVDEPQFEDGVNFFVNAAVDGPYRKYPYPTLAAAKAACERHHATGKWE